MTRAPSGPTRLRRPVPSAAELRTLMQQFRGNVAHVANHLGRQWAVISRTLRRYGIDPAEFRPPEAGGFAAAGVRRLPDADSGEADAEPGATDADEEGDTLG